MFSIDYIKEWSESYKTDLTTNIMGSADFPGW